MNLQRTFFYATNIAIPLRQISETLPRKAEKIFNLKTTTTIMADVNPTMERVYCMPSNDNTQLLAELINAKGHGTDAAQMAALFSRDNNNWQNNPFMYLIWLAWMNNGGFGFGGNNAAAQSDVLTKLNSLQNQITDNNNNSVALDAIRGNNNAIHDIATALNTNFASVAQAVASVQNAITQVGGNVGYSGEKVINAVTLGNQNIVQQLKDCCCTTQQSIIRMGYDNQLGQKDVINALGQQTYQLGERFTGIANGIQQGFSATAYETQRSANQLLEAGERNTQRIIDTLNNHWVAEQSQELQSAKFEISQMRQNETIAKMLATGANNCGCNYGAV